MASQNDWGKRRKSTYSNGADNCVEVAHSTDGDAVGVWDTKHRQAGPITFGQDQWREFVKGLKD